MNNHKLTLLLRLVLMGLAGAPAAWAQEELLNFEAIAPATDAPAANAAPAAARTSAINAAPAAVRASAANAAPAAARASAAKAKPAAGRASAPAASQTELKVAAATPAVRQPASNVAGPAPAASQTEPKVAAAAPAVRQPALNASPSALSAAPAASQREPEVRASARSDRPTWQRQVAAPRARSASSGAPAPASGQGGTTRAWFRQMVLAALNHSPEVRGAVASLEQSSWNVEQVKGKRYPQLKVGMNTPFDTFGSGRSVYNTSPTDTSASVSLTTTLFDWGKIGADLDSARAGMSAAEMSVKEAREQIAASTATELLNLSRYQASMEKAARYAARMQGLVNMLSQIAAADKGRASELTQARARLLSAQASQDQIRHQYDATLIKLVRLLGFEPQTPPGLRWNDGLIPAAAALAALEHHPTLLRSDADARAAEAKAEAIQAAGRPQVNWVVSKSTAKNAVGDEDAWYTGLNVEWSLFSGGSERAAHQAARAEARSMREKKQTTQLELSYQIRAMIETRDASLRRAEEYDRLCVETDKVRQMFYDQWYHLGKRTLLDVLTAESEHFNNEISAINNRYDGYVSNVEIMHHAALLLNWLADRPGGTNE